MVGTRRRRRGIYLLPTLFTVANLFCGFSSVILASRGRFETAAILIIIAAVLDGLDGRIARLTGTTSAFGLEFDSLADIVSFGVAPAFLAFSWTLGAAGRVGWLIAFLFVVCAATRLARFNLRASTGGDKRHFAGMPSPMAGAVVASGVYAFPELTPSRVVGFLLSFTLCALALSMVSHLRYRSFKELDLRNRRSYLYVLPLAACLVAMAYDPPNALLLLSVGYWLSAPVMQSVAWVRRIWLGEAPAANAESPLTSAEVSHGPVGR